VIARCWGIADAGTPKPRRNDAAKDSEYSGSIFSPRFLSSPASLIAWAALALSIIGSPWVLKNSTASKRSPRASAAFLTALSFRLYAAFTSAPRAGTLLPRLRLPVRVPAGGNVSFPAPPACLSLPEIPEAVGFESPGPLSLR